MRLKRFNLNHKEIKLIDDLIFDLIILTVKLEIIKNG